MKVSELMTTNVLTVRPDAKVDEIARLMVAHDITGVPVVNGENRVVGIVTETDLIVRNAHLHFPTFLQILDARIYLQSPRHFEEELRRMLGTTAADVMTKDVVTTRPDADLDEVATLMVEQAANPVPVVENGKLVGIISRSDIVRLMAHEQAV
ncbi:MAG: CBS domain-containing protein [Chloroflexi bacterium]|nr:CBS domain-containing protein [Chloroflexota bacterium]